MSSNTGGNVGDFTKFAENRNRHEVESAEIRAVILSLEPDQAAFDTLVEKMGDAAYVVSAEEDKFFKDRQEVMVALEARVKAEESRWAKEYGEYMASKKTSGTFSSPFSSSEGLGSTTWQDADGVIHALSGASQSEVNKNLPGSEAARRWMCATNLGLFVSSSQELKVEDIRSALSVESERSRVETMLAGGVSYQLQIGAGPMSGPSTAIRVRLTRCPAFKEKAKFGMALGKTAFRPGELNIMDFGEATDAKDCGRITVVRMAVMYFGEFFCFAFGDHHRGGIVKNLRDAVHCVFLEEATRKHPL